MTINKIQNNSEVILEISGWLDTQSSPMLQEEIQNLNTFSSLVFDFKDLEFISSSGLREVVSAFKLAKENNAEFKIINASEEVMDIFKMTGFDKKLNIL